MDTIEFLYSIIGTPMGWILFFLYEFVISNIGIAIILFTLIVKLAMLPLAIKQQKNTAKSAIFAPKVNEIRQKYRNNQQKQQEELMKLQQQGYNPMGGCGTMILTFLILFGVLDVVYKPMTHIMHVPSEKTDSIIEESYSIEFAAIFVNEYTNTAELEGDALARHEEILRDAQQILDYYNNNLLKEGESPKEPSVWSGITEESKSVVKNVIIGAMKAEYAKDTGKALFTDTDLYKLSDEENEELKGITNEEERAAYNAQHRLGDKTREAINTLQSHFGYYRVTGADTVSFQRTASLQRELFALESFGTGSNKDAYAPNVIGTELREELIELYDNLNFLGIPLGQVPIEHMGFPMILVPIAAFLFALAQTFVSNKIMEKNNPAAAASMGGMKVTMYIMPVVSLILVFSVPAGAGFYWTISYVFGIAQSLALNKLYSPEKLRAQAEAEYAERMKVVSTKAAAVRDSDNDDSVAEYKGEKLTQKEINRRKLAEARRADAIKYGEEYKEDDED